MSVLPFPLSCALGPGLSVPLCHRGPRRPVESEASFRVGVFLVLGGGAVKVGRDMAVSAGLCGGYVLCTEALWP